MSAITAELVNKLRQKTNAGMMDCKKALTEAQGDFDAAETLLRKKGIAKAEGKADRATKEGVVHAVIDAAVRKGVLVEVNCETDFVAKNENFKGFVNELATRVLSMSGATEAVAADPAVTETIKAKIAELGENIVLRRLVRFDARESGGPALLQSYIHLAGRVGVLVEVGCEKEASLGQEGMQVLAKDLCLHIAAASPRYLRREDVPADVVAKEREIFAGQVAGKPANIVDKIVDGKMNKFYADFCLLEQAFIKDQEKSIGDVVKAAAAQLGDTITMRRFTRYAVGGE
jgi:elongation factor Ts